MTRIRKIAAAIRDALDHRGAMHRIAAEGAAAVERAKNENWARYVEANGNHALAARLREPSPWASRKPSREEARAAKSMPETHWARRAREIGLP